MTTMSTSSAPHPVGLEVVQEAAPGRVGRIGRLGAEPGVHSTVRPPGADQVGAEIEAHPVRVEMGLVRGPRSASEIVGKKLQRWDFQHAVGRAT